MCVLSTLLTTTARLADKVCTACCHHHILTCISFATTTIARVQADLVYLMLSDLAASSSVYDGEDGVLAALKDGKSLIDCATLTPERMVRLLCICNVLRSILLSIVMHW
jgi:hypothetical protein